LILDAVVTESNVVEPSSVDSKASAPAPTAAPAPAVEAPVPPASKEAAAAPDSKGKGVYAGPAVRRLAREFGVPLGSVKSSGPRGRILKEDLHQYVSRALAAPGEGSGGAGIPVIPDVDFSAFGPVDVVERSKIDKITATNMQRNWLNVPHVTQFDDADITEMEAFRKSLKAEAEKRGSRLTPLPFLLKACAVALKRNEKINSSLSDGGSTLTYKRYVHIGMAVDTPAGLVVPVIRDVDQKTLWELADEVIELAGKARDRKLKPADMQGGGFTVSSLGSIGGRGFTPIVNAPEVAILGVSRANTQPVWDGQSFQPRLQLPLALSYDHRVVNGGDAGRFLTELCQLLGDIRNLLL
jgi:pyruvate dehydrogenase E2 component (dihydrolipoamide acetyltransferase)